MIKFHSKVVSVNEMGGKVVVEFKEKIFESGVESPVVDDNTVTIYDTVEKATDAMEAFFSGNSE